MLLHQLHFHNAIFLDSHLVYTFIVHYVLLLTFFIYIYIGMGALMCFKCSVHRCPTKCYLLFITHITTQLDADEIFFGLSGSSST